MTARYRKMDRGVRFLGLTPLGPSDEALHDLSTPVTTVDCLVPQAGVPAMRPLIVPASSKSQSEAPRRVLQIEYASSASVGDGLVPAMA